MTSRRRYAVIGQPVAHSLSPRIHGMFASQLGLPVDYDLLDPDGRSFADCVRGFIAAGGRGLNVTLPFKSDALAIADHPSAGARQAGAANTLKADESGQLSACNTDGAGLLVDLKRRHGFDPAGMRIVVLGAGGAAAGILGSLLGASPAGIVVVNRTYARAVDLVGRFASGETSLEAATLDELDGISGELVIDTTAAGHGKQQLALPAALLGQARLAYALSYGPAAQLFLQQATAAGAARSVDGLGMLVEQAALSFAYWEGRMPDTDPVYASLAKEVQAQ